MKLWVLILLIASVACKPDEKYEVVTDENRLISTNLIPDDHFLGDNNCKTCHSTEFEDWQGSHHDKAMQLADSVTVLADFKGETFSSQGVTSRFYQKDGDFYVNTEGPDGEYHDYKIVYTFGITPLQQYIVKFPDGYYQCLRTAWDTKENKWFDLYPDFKIVHSEWLHWSRGGLNWNNMCSDCHSTNVRKNYDPVAKSYDTKYSLINVSCEACHGPGKKHVEEVNRLGKDYKTTGELRMTLNTSPKQLVDDCARCHMRREQFSSNYNYEGSMLDHYFPQLIETPTYYPDGQILDEDYVYGSFIQSKMYQNNVSCNNCHNVHSTKLKFDGNALCTQCHIPAQFDTPDHHFHKQGTEGAKCINCHMPGKYYMGNDFRRDHSFRIPRPDQSLKYNTPNACTQCHSDKNNEWAWNAFQKLFGKVDSIHFSDKLIPGITGDPHGDESLLELINDTKQPEMARASAVKALSHYNSTKDLIDKYIAFLNDKSPLVRAASVDVLGEINTSAYIQYFLPLLKDPKRTVRVKAFYGLASLPSNQVPEEYRTDYLNVEKEFNTYIRSNSDFPGGLVREANYYIKKGNLVKAIEGYENALKIDNINNMARFNLANLYYSSGDFTKAEETFKTIISQEPGYGPTYYSLGLLLTESGRNEEAVEQLKKAVSLMPENIRIYYNLGLLYDKTGKPAEAEKTLMEGLKLDENNEDLMFALAYHYANNDQITRAKSVLIKLIQQHPENRQYEEFLNSL